jgi:hypothetical protein
MLANSKAGPVEDQGHPISRLDTLDTHLTTDQRAYVGIIIASPLRDDEISRTALQEKVEFVQADAALRRGLTPA